MEFLLGGVAGYFLAWFCERFKNKFVKWGAFIALLVVASVLSLVMFIADVEQRATNATMKGISNYQESVDRSIRLWTRYFLLFGLFGGGARVVVKHQQIKKASL